MKNLFFVVLSFAFFLTSCTKDFVEPAIHSEQVKIVKNRTETVVASSTVNSVEVGIEDLIIHLVIPEGTPTGLTPADSQNFQFTDSNNNVETVELQVSASEVGIEDLIIHLVIPPNGLTNLTILDTQTVAFN